MVIPAEFNYTNEDDFIQRFLIPLLKRLGFSVVNYHGTREFGKDLVFAEMDRFGHVRYHALQAKYEASISLGDSKGLIEDCDQAFANPFVHPHTGASERISSFYAVNGGDISEPARTNYFNQLIRYGSNVRLLDGKSLIALDRWAAFNRGEMVGETLTGMLIEIRVNRRKMATFQPMLQAYVEDTKKPLPIERLRDAGTTNYLLRPLSPNLINVDEVLWYSEFARMFNNSLEFCLKSLASEENKKDLLRKVIEQSVGFYIWGNHIEEAIQSVLSQLGPLAGL